MTQRIPRWLQINPAITQAVLALIALTVGFLVYHFDRAPDTVYFLSDISSTTDSHALLFGELGRQLPEFLHVFALILLTCAILSPKPRGVLVISTCWFGIDGLFEIGQHALIAPHLAAWVPAWFQHMPILDNTASYFLQGIYDPLDLLAIAIGAIAGYFTSSMIVRIGINNHEECSDEIPR